jgi:dTDP-4-amino-4,6-dideoxy-D-glucose acyltransferase
MVDFLSANELVELQLGACGEDVCISRRAVILSPESVHIGSHSRIDAFCVISGSSKGVSIGSHVHLSAYVSILGADRVTIEDFCTISVRCSLFTSNDDYLGLGLTNPTVPLHTRELVNGPIHLEKHCIIGCGSIILPNVRIGKSAAVGALSLIKSDVDDFAIVAGTPLRRIGTRRAEHLSNVDALLRDRTS